ncbi:MAG: tetratricopeptide repeat protein [Phycisphaerae bacterium]|nr:tetratricopeptide repeat protein [Phycisphaerae bacterium]
MPAKVVPAPPVDDGKLSWRDVWQLPAVLLAAGLVGGGVVYVASLPRDNDFSGTLDQVDELLASGHLPEAKGVLFDTIAPKLEQASDLDRARFEATTADWLVAARSGVGSAAAENDLQIAARYAKAEEQGFELDRERLLHWAAALVRVGRTEEALEKVNNVKAEGNEVDVLRNRVRRMVMDRAWEQAIKDERPNWGEILVGLGTFRADASVTLADEAWTAARQAEARLALDRPREAADRLLLDLRRLESATATDRGSIPPEAYAELSSLLGRAYAALGDIDLARDSLERAVAMSDGKSIAKGEAILLLGQLALQRGDLDEAEQRFGSVLTDYSGEDCYVPALLGRAETHAAHGDNVEALDDYRTVRTKINTVQTRRVTAQEVIGSLIDRHDALLVGGDLERALDYAKLAADFQPGRPTPAELLLRLATTGRSLADQLIQGEDAHDPEYQAVAARLLKFSAGWFLEHANHPDTARENADGWAESMWLAADSFERAGWSDDAMRSFRQFIEARPTGDLRRAEAMFRVAAILHAEGAIGEAAAEYARVIDEFPTSPLASRATVPLARCLDATDRRADAIARLQATVDGTLGLKPDAQEFRDALLELARLVVANDELARGASLFDEALRRYPDDRRVAETRFLLGECRRGLARKQSRQLTDGALSPSQRASIDAQRVTDLETARAEFEQVVLALDSRVTGSGLNRDESKLDPLERDALRLAHLYRADCLFDLGRYRDAIDLYEIAERRYSDSAVSMIALIQILNAWHELGDYERAATAQRRAELRLLQLPDVAFLEAGSIFSRDAWERWLKNAPPGTRIASSNGASDDNGMGRRSTPSAANADRETPE